MALAVEILTLAAETAVEQLTPHALDFLAEAGWEPTAEVIGMAIGGYQKYKQARQVGKIASRIVSGPRFQEQEQEQQQQQPSQVNRERTAWEKAVKSAMKLQIRYTPTGTQLRSGAKRIITTGMRAGVIPR